MRLCAFARNFSFLHSQHTPIPHNSYMRGTVIEKGQVATCPYKLMEMTNLFTVHCLLFTAHCSLFTAHCFLVSILDSRAIILVCSLREMTKSSVLYSLIILHKLLFQPSIEPLCKLALKQHTILRLCNPMVFIGEYKHACWYVLQFCGIECHHSL